MKTETSPVLEIVRVGVASIQDAGRFGYEHLGVARCGFGDAQAASMGNLLLGNQYNAACIEVQKSALKIRFLSKAVVLWTGALAKLSCNQVPCMNSTPILVKAGDELEVGEFINGNFGYLCLAGGINSAIVLGSQSTDSNSKWGQVLRRGDHLLGNQLSASYRILAQGIAADRHLGLPIRVLPVHLALAHQLCAQPWRIAPNSNRMGFRLLGNSLTDVPASVPSAGVCAGLIQVPPNGQPIILGPDAGTTGGYPVLGSVISADFARLMQSQGAIRFSLCDLSQALQAQQALDRSLARFQTALAHFCK